VNTRYFNSVLWEYAQQWKGIAGFQCCAIQSKSKPFDRLSPELNERRKKVTMQSQVRAIFLCKICGEAFSPHL